jgi:hypothetical protein
LPSETTITLTQELPRKLVIGDLTGGATPTRDGWTWSGILSGAVAPPIISITPGGSPGGFIPLSDFDVDPIAGVGDETIVNFNTPAFKFGSETYTTIGMVSNGYAVVGGGTSQDIDFVPQTFPDPAAPNNVLAPYWTDLNPSVGGALRIAELTDGVNIWLVLEWENVPVFTGHAPRSFQIWIQEGATESVTYAYGSNLGPGDPEGLNVGAENRDGSSGVNLGAVPASDSDYTITTGSPSSGGSVTIGYDATARGRVGTFPLTVRMTSGIVVGTTTDVETITVVP